MPATDLLSGRVAVVSGIGPGLGQGIAVLLARHGADLVLLARRKENLDLVGAGVEALGRSALSVPTDITDPGQCADAIAQAIERFGHIDVLVNNAYVGGTRFPFLDTYGTEADNPWRQTVEVNYFGSLTMTHAAAKAMVAQGSGSIVMIASMAIRDVQPKQGPYAASKAALVMAARTLAVELGPSGIRVNTVVPGYIDGPAVRTVFERDAAAQGRTAAEVRDEFESRMALRHMPDDEEIAGTVVYLASDLSKYVTGQAVDVNAGYWV